SAADADRGRVLADDQRRPSVFGLLVEQAALEALDLVEVFHAEQEDFQRWRGRHHYDSFPPCVVTAGTARKPLPLVVHTSLQVYNVKRRPGNPDRRAAATAGMAPVGSHAW